MKFLHFGTLTFYPTYFCVEQSRHCRNFYCSNLFQGEATFGPKLLLFKTNKTLLQRSNITSVAQIFFKARPLGEFLTQITIV